MAIASVNPVNGELIKSFKPLSSAEIESKLALAFLGLQKNRELSFEERAQKMRRVAQILQDEADLFAKIMTLEMGKTLKSAKEEATKCAANCLYYADHAAKFLHDEWLKDPVSGKENAYVRYEPMGIVLAVMPWNFPFWQVMRFAAPALMAGNVGLLKHASNVPQCALALEDLFMRAGFPAGSFQTLLIGSDQVGPLLSDPRVAAATLTGSEAAGIEVASEAGRQLKKTVLELGGSDPFIVMPSADMNKAVKTAVQSRMINNGQSCIAAKRFLIHEQVYDRFTAEFTNQLSKLVVGDPMSEQTDLGPLSSSKAADELEKQIKEAVENGGKLLLGGKRVPGVGAFFEPTLLAFDSHDSPISRKEFFGPVALLFRVKNLENAIELANATQFGLGSSVWTKDVQERERFVQGIQAGQVFVNSMVASQPHLPFGGVKRSGYGRELSSFGIREFVNVKTVRLEND